MKVASFEKAEWIDPWRDRVPQTEDKVIVTAFERGLRCGDSTIRGKLVVDFDHYVPNVGWGCHSTVLAWMPLPDKYDPVAEAERQDEEERNPIVWVEKIR